MVSKTDKCMKSLDKTDVYLIKLSSMSFILFLITVWPAAMTWVQSVHWGWFLGAMIVFMLRPFKKYLKA